jgi:hypothetical protein
MTVLKLDNNAFKTMPYVLIPVRAVPEIVRREGWTAICICPGDGGFSNIMCPQASPWL